MTDMVTPDKILSTQPAYRDDWELITKRQYVPDIIKEVVKAHKLFGWYYDQFSYMFYDRDPAVVADNIYDFCKRYLEYKEETVDVQTSAIPAGILYRGYITQTGVDCKHYALFSSGVIGSLNRLYNCCFAAKFFFVGYGKATEPYHVFVSILDRARDTEIWIDPTPGSGGMPTLLVEKPV